jgi:hypothetical protein
MSPPGLGLLSLLAAILGWIAGAGDGLAPSHSSSASRRRAVNRSGLSFIRPSRAKAVARRNPHKIRREVEMHNPSRVSPWVRLYGGADGRASRQITHSAPEVSPTRPVQVGSSGGTL